MTRAPARRTYKYFDFIMVAYVTVMMCSNLISAGKVAQLGSWTFGAGILFFPISYLFGDILTEVYGYAQSRRVVWAGFGAMVFTSLVTWIVLTLPPAPFWTHQAEWVAVFGGTPRIAAASLLAFFAGEFTNSFVLAKLKVMTEGKYLWVRTIGSTIAGEGVDSLVFYPLAFLGIWEPAMVLQVMFTNYWMKVLWEVLATPFTYKIVAFLKRAEHEDYYDRHTNFSPFVIN